MSKRRDFYKVISSVYTLPNILIPNLSLDIRFLHKKRKSPIKILVNIFLKIFLNKDTNKNRLQYETYRYKRNPNRIVCTHKKGGKSRQESKRKNLFVDRSIFLANLTTCRRPTLNLTTHLLLISINLS